MLKSWGVPGNEATRLLSDDALDTSSPHIVQVVSMLEAPRRLGSVSFQSKEVRGAQNSEFLFCKRVRREKKGEKKRERERCKNINKYKLPCAVWNS